MKIKSSGCLLLASMLCWSLPSEAAENGADTSMVAKRASGPFACGKFGPNVTNSPNADLGMIATASFATPGVPVPVTFLEQGSWFLIDDFGSGPLMGCQPATSQLQGELYPRINSYNELGMLKQQIVQVYNVPGGGESPVPLKFLYMDANRYRVTYAEQLCYLSGSGSTLSYRLTFTYSGNQLSQLNVTQDPGCTDYAGTYTFTYGSAAVSNLPTKVDFVDGHGGKQTWKYDYQVASNLLQRVDFGGGNITYVYSGTLLRQTIFTFPVAPPLSLIMNYTPDLQWLSALDARFNWGLAMQYSNGKVVSARQSTGCGPDMCPAAVFTYASKRMSSQATCYLATRQEHVAAGRASAIKGQVYAKGSGRFLGAEGLAHVVPLRELGTAKFYPDRACY
jgi:hypothetical protein